MRLQAITCAALCGLLTGCGDARPVVVAPVIPPELLLPADAPCPEVVSEGDVARCLVRKAGALRQANGQIAAIAAIVGAQ